MLLVEPGYYTRYPPLGLLKLSSYHKSLGDTTELVRVRGEGLRRALRAVALGAVLRREDVGKKAYIIAPLIIAAVAACIMAVGLLVPMHPLTAYVAGYYAGLIVSGGAANRRDEHIVHRSQEARPLKSTSLLTALLFLHAAELCSLQGPRV